MPYAPTLPDAPKKDASNEERAKFVGELRNLVMEAAAYGYDVRRRMRAPGYQPTDKDKLDAKSAIEFITEFDPLLSAAERGVEVELSEVSGPSAATLELYANPGYETAGSIVTSDERYKKGVTTFDARALEIEVAGSLFASNDYDWRDDPAAQVRATIDTGISDGTPGDAGYFLPRAQPVPPVPRAKRTFIRDLLSVQGTTMSSIPYIREWNPSVYELGASAVTEGSTKPEVILAFEDDDAPVRKVAAWVPVTTEILDDAATLRGYIDTRLAYMLALREEWDIIRGSGSSGTIKGITQFTGLQTASNADEPVAVASGIGLIENQDAEADGLVMNPIKYWTMVATRRSTNFDGAATGNGNAPFGGPPGTLWGLPVVRSRAMATTKGLLGGFRMGATLFDRMRTTIRVGNQHSTYFVENKVAILAEERVALAVHRPDLFVDVTFS